MLSRSDELRQSVADLHERLDAVRAVVKQCADVADQINRLADVRNPAEAELVTLKSVNSPDVTVEEKDARTKRIEQLEEQVETYKREMARLHGPFQPAEAQVRGFISDLRRVLSSLPVEPQQLRGIRAEIEKLSVWANVLKHFPPLPMQGTYDDLLIVKARLAELLEYFPKRSGMPTLHPFPTPVGAAWNDVSIRFTGDLAAQIAISGVTEARNYVEMGFEDRRKRTPTSTSSDSAWSLLREFAKQGGIIRDPQEVRRKTWSSVETGVKHINKKLRVLFGIAGNPIQYHRPEKHYRTKFHVTFPGADRL